MATTGWSLSSTGDGGGIMKILVTNDDGIDSPGIKALADAVSFQPSAVRGYEEVR